MTPLEPIQALAQADGHGDQADDTLRQRALDLAAAGLPLSASEMARVFRESLGQFHKKAKRGVYDPFLLAFSTGPKRYSGVLVQRHLNGHALDVPVFGRKRRA